MVSFDGKYQKTIHILAQALTISEIVAFHIFDVENLGQDRGVQGW